MSCSVFNQTVYIGVWRSAFEGEILECIYWGINSWLFWFELEGARPGGNNHSPGDGVGLCSCLFSSRCSVSVCGGNRKGKLEQCKVRSVISALKHPWPLQCPLAVLVHRMGETRGAQRRRSTLWMLFTHLNLFILFTGRPVFYLRIQHAINIYFIFCFVLFLPWDGSMENTRCGPMFFIHTCCEL